MINDEEWYIRRIVVERIDKRHLPLIINDENTDVLNIVKERLKNGK